MGLLDVFKAKENENLKNKIEELNLEFQKLKLELEKAESLITPEMKDLMKIKKEIGIKINEKEDIKKEISNMIEEKEKVNKILINKNKQIIDLDEKIFMNDLGVYKPRYDLETSEEYKIKINNIIARQKNMIKSNIAFSFNPNWTVNDSRSEGKKMSKNMGKQAIKLFNLEFEVLKNKVKYNNLESIEAKLLKSFNAINDLNKIVGVKLSDDFCKIKLEELHLYFELENKKKEEKERRKELARQLKEEEKLKKELEESKKNIIKDQKHYNKELERINKLIEKEPNSEFLLSEKNRIENELEELDHKMKDLDYRQENQKAGYVYIISNEGAFGKDIYKIGMTRRLEPLERIKELSGASVPFMFNVHTLMFTDDAPGLEHELHNYFDSSRLNKINHRKEFFKITNVEEIKNVIKKKTNETFGFIENPIIEDYFPVEDQEV